jgi:hypothetical protein
VLSFFKLTLDEIQEQPDYIEFVKSKANQQFDLFDAKVKDFFEIPKNWFIKENGKPEKFNDKITISANKHFTQFAFLNDKKRMYLAYDNNIQFNPEDYSEYYTNLEMVK